MAFFITIIITVLVTLLIAVVVLNLRSAERTMDYQIACNHSCRDPHFSHVMSHLLGPAMVGGNRITPLRNGVQIFPAMLDAIRGARHTITFETYIYWAGRIGEAFAEALSERARAGVRVHVLIDYVGSQSMERHLLEQMLAAGCEVEFFHPVHWYNLAKLNHRTHRKILVADGRIGFTGGVGIADEWAGDARNPDEWRDSHFQVEGPVAAQLQAAFTDNWLKTQAKVLHEPEYYPKIEAAGSAFAQVFKSSPQEGSGSARLMFMLSIAAARSTIVMASSYFVPDDLAIAALLAAAERGVRVRIIVPGKYNDLRIVRRASRNSYGRLLRGGVEIYEYQPSMYHCKLLVVDDCWVSVGSANFDTRSFRLNDEANLNALDEELAAALMAQLQDDLALCKQMEYSRWRRRPLREKGMEFLASLLRHQL